MRSGSQIIMFPITLETTQCLYTEPDLQPASSLKGSRLTQVIENMGGPYEEQIPLQ